MLRSTRGPLSRRRRSLALALVTLFLASGLLSLAPTATADSAAATGWNLPTGRARTSTVFDGGSNAYVVGGWDMERINQVVRVNLNTGATAVVATLPTPRYYTSSVWANGYIYVFGGYDTSGHAINQIVRVDPNAGTATIVAYLPTDLEGTTAAFDGTHAYVFGGLPSASTSGNPVVRFTPSNNQVVTMSARTPLYLYEARAWYDASSGNVYVAGGFDFSSHRRNVLRYTPSTDTLIDLGQVLPIGRYESGIAWDGTYAYLFGAQTGSTDIIRYHPATNTAVTMDAKMSPGRRSASAVWANGKAYVFGGIPDNYDGTNKLTEILRYSLEPGAPGTPTASSTCAGAITLSWPAASPTSYSRLTGYRIYRAVNGGAESLLKSVGDVTSTTDSLSSGSTYAYRVAAYSTTDGDGPKSAAATGTVACPPGAPQSPGATGGTRQITVSWSAPASNNGAAVTNYRIYRGTTSGGETLLATIGTNTSFVDATLGNGDTRYYKVSALNVAGEGAATASVSATTHVPPGAPQSPGASPTGVGQVTVTWSAPASNGGTAVTGYKVYRDGTAIATLGASATSHADSGLGNGVAYSYRVSALNAAGEGAQSTAVSATTWTAPGAPGGLTASPASVGQIALSWSAPASNGGSAVTGYKVYRDGALRTTLSAASTTYTDTGLGNGATHAYHVSAINAVGESAQAGPASATTINVPGAPTASAAAGPGAGVITVSWNAPASTGGSAITGYKVYRGASAGQATELVATLGSTARSWQDSGLGNGATRYYRVSATNAVGEGAASAEASAVTHSPPGAPTNVAAATGSSAGQISLSWSAPTSNGGSAVTSYVVYRGTASGATTYLATTTSTAFTDSGIPTGERRYYRVSAVNVAGEGLASVEVSGTAPLAPAAPTDLVAATGQQAGGSIDLSWQAPPQNGPAVTSYRVQRTTVSGGETFSFTVSGGATTFSDTGLYPGIRYYYAVSAINSVGEGPTSGQAMARASLAPASQDPDGDLIPTTAETRICSAEFLFALVTFISPDAPLAGECQTLTGDYEAMGYYDEDQDLIADKAEEAFCLAQDRYDPADGICVGKDYGLPPMSNMQLVQNLLNRA